MVDKNAQKELDTVRNDLKQLQGDVASLVASLKSLGLDKASQAGETVKETAEEQLEKLRAAISSAKNQGANQLDNLQKEVSDRPLTSVATAFAVGFIISKLLDRS